MRAILAFGLLALLIGCSRRQPDRPRCEPRRAGAYAPSPVVRERDELFSLLAYAIAADDFQPRGPTARGRNIAAVLADADGKPLCWARNAVLAEDDATQHAEVRVLTSYLRSNPGTHADRTRLYVTLEPCVMCAGTTLMTGVGTVLFGQHAGVSGSVYDRLAYDGSEHGGQCPYPFSLTFAPAPTDFVARFDARAAGPGTNTFVDGPEQRTLLDEAARALDAFRVDHPENEPVLASIRRFRASIPRASPHAPYAIGCPDFPAAGDP